MKMQTQKIPARMSTAERSEFGKVGTLAVIHSRECLGKSS